MPFSSCGPMANSLKQSDTVNSISFISAAVSVIRIIIVLHEVICLRNKRVHVRLLNKRGAGNGSR